MSNDRPVSPCSDLDPGADAPQIATEAQLYNLNIDPNQRNNVFSRQPEIAAKMLARMKELKLISKKP